MIEIKELKTLAELEKVAAIEDKVWGMPALPTHQILTAVKNGGIVVGAYDGDTLIGLAACSADCEMMYQIGVDVLPEYRQKGVAAAITSRLALEIIALGKVPFYCAAWCNIKSVRNAIKSGFRPAWVELTARDITFVDKMNE